MIPVRRNIDTDELIMWLDPSSPLSFIKSEAINSIAGKKNLFTGTVDFINDSSSSNIKTDWTDTSSSNPTSRGLLGVTKVPSGAVIDPEGGTDTVLLQEDASTGDHRLRFDLNIEGVNAGPPQRTTNSLYVKQAPGAARQITIVHTNTAPNTGGVTYDFATSTLNAINLSGIEDYGVINVGSGWFRIWYTTLFDGITSNQATCRTLIQLRDASGSGSYAGDGSSGVYIWGPQWEEGALSNYSPRSSNADFKTFQSWKLGKTDTSLNPVAYTTTFDGTNLRFNGLNNSLTGQFVRGPFRPGSSNNTLQNHTGFAWIKLDRSSTPTPGAWSPNVYTILGRIAGKNNNGVFGIDESGTKIVYKGRTLQSTGAQYTFSYISSTVSDLNNQWHFVAFSYDIPSKTASFYLDGQPVGTSTAPSPNAFLGMQGSSGGIQLGNYTSGVVLGQFKGMMNISGFYNKSLNATEHEALYNATKYRFHNN